MTLTYLDASVLIAAARASGLLYTAATALLGDSRRQFVASDFVRLETLPKPTYFGRTAEIHLFMAYFAAVRVWVPISPALVQLAIQRAETFGLNGMDDLHIAAAELGGAEEFITAERATKPFFRVTTLRIVSIHP